MQQFQQVFPPAAGFRCKQHPAMESAEEVFQGAERIAVLNIGANIHLQFRRGGRGKLHASGGHVLGG